MAVDAAEVAIIAELVRKAPRPVTVLGLGHPDILATPAEVAHLFGGKLLGIDNERVRKERLGPSEAECIGSAFILFEALGATLTALDRRDLFGVEENVDLNYPIAPRHRSAYSLVIDPGTTEHILNIGQALTSVVQSMKVGGYAYHQSPMVMLNHGYWNYSPAAYHDFYKANGCEIVRLQGRRRGEWFDVPSEARFKAEADGGRLLITCIARKIREVETIGFPMQAKYR